MTKYCYKKDAWTPTIGGYDTYEDAARDFRAEFYYSPNLPNCSELVRIAAENGVNPNDIEAVENLFASFAVHSYES